LNTEAGAPPGGAVVADRLARRGCGVVVVVVVVGVVVVVVAAVAVAGVDERR
jgi:t-SNARE complex subunit (syntaxin)